MKRNALLMAGAVSAAALATSLSLANVALAQEAPVTQSVTEPKTQEQAAKTSTSDSTQSVRQIVIEPKAVDDPKAKPAIAAEPETKALGTEETDATAVAEQADLAKTEAVPDKAAEPENEAVAVEEGKVDPATEQGGAADEKPEAETATSDVVADPKAAAKTEKVDETAAGDAAEAEEPAETTTDVVSKENAAVPVKRSPEEIVLALQTELKRVGCYDGAVDGVWGGYSQEALEAFRHFGRIDHNDAEPSEVWIAHVKGATKTICHADHYGDAYPSQHQGYNHSYQTPSYNGYRGSYPGGSTYRY